MSRQELLDKASSDRQRQHPELLQAPEHWCAKVFRPLPLYTFLPTHHQKFGMQTSLLLPLASQGRRLGSETSRACTTETSASPWPVQGLCVRLLVILRHGPRLKPAHQILDSLHAFLGC